MSDSSRVESLDSIRGIASLIVLAGHFYVSLPAFRDHADSLLHSLSQPWNFLLYCLIKLIIAGKFSVILFFVLSGFVLTISLTKRKQSYKKFMLTRFFRIYPVLFISVMLSYALHIYIDSNNINTLPQGQLEKPVQNSIENLIGHLMLIGLSPQHIYLDNPIWSLVHEFRISLLFPFLLLLFINKKPGLIMLLSLLASAASAYFVFSATGIPPTGYSEKDIAATLATTIYFIVFFSIGILIALKRDQISNIMNKFQPIIKFLLILFPLSCIILSSKYFTNLNSMLVDYTLGVGAAILIILALNWPSLARLLSIRPLLWLGHISYSLYLVHKVILYAVDKSFGDILPYWQIIAVVVILSLLCADIMARLVEYPCIKLGKKLLNKMQ
jgi:peptidoglycan/LPS O-acetylase OafA/YrhL